MFSWIEFGLAIMAIVMACAAPRLGSNWFERTEQFLNRLAQRRGLAIGIAGLGALGARAALLPILPIPHPGVLDEFGYLLLSDTFAHGRLTNPTHPMWVHFETFFTIWQPTYTSMYYPAQGLIMAFGQVLMGHPFWGVWLSLGLMCAAICWMLQGWLPPGWALLGGLLAVIRLGTFSYWANSYWGGAVAATGGALVLGALPRIKRTQRARDALLMGLGFAILANSRPYEGLFLGLPVAGALVVWMFGKNRPRPWRAATHIGAPLFLVLGLTGCAMGYYFWRTTGSPFDTPYLVYVRSVWGTQAGAGAIFPGQPDAPAPVYRHAFLRDYRRLMVRQYEAMRSVKARLTGGLTVLIQMWEFYLGAALGLPILMALATLPYGFSFRNVDPDTRFLILVSGSVLAGSMLPIYFMPHYAAPIAAALLALVLRAMRQLRSLKGVGPGLGQFVTRSVPLICLLMLALRVAARPLHLPEPGRYPTQGPPIWCALTPSDMARFRMLTKLKRLPGRQLAIVRYGQVQRSEWVFNDADIDGAKVVWARDMGPSQNKELIDYFHDRHVWLLEPDETPPALLPYPEGVNQTLAPPSQRQP